MADPAPAAAVDGGYEPLSHSSIGDLEVVAAGEAADEEDRSWVTRDAKRDRGRGAAQRRDRSSRQRSRQRKFTKDAELQQREKGQAHLTKKGRRLGRLGRRDSLGYIVNSRGEMLVPHALPNNTTELQDLRAKEEMYRERWRLNLVFWVSICLMYCSVVALILDKNTEDSDLPPMWARNSKLVQQVAFIMLVTAQLLFVLLIIRAMYIYETWVPCKAIRSCATKADCMSAACAKMAAYGTLCVIVLSTLPYFVWYCFAHEAKPHLVAWWVSGVFALLATLLSMHTIWGHVKHGTFPQQTLEWMLALLYALTERFCLRALVRLVDARRSAAQDPRVHRAYPAAGANLLSRVLPLAPLPAWRGVLHDDAGAL